jgi:L,D-transpeptidase ErfK/SrfK
VVVSVPAKQLPLILTLFLFILPYSAHADSFIGGKTTVVAQGRDCGSVIAARFGVDWKIVARENGLNGQTVCKAGQQLSINNLRIVPKVIEEGIIVNVPDRMLYFFKNSELVAALPVGLGLPEKAWQTPIGPFSIVRKVTKSHMVCAQIDSERDEGKRPAGPDRRTSRKEEPSWTVCLVYITGKYTDS